MKPIHIGLICIFFLYGCVGPAASEKSVLSAKQLKLPGKKGVCFTLRQPGAKKGGTIEKNMPRVKALNASWNYSWGLDIVREQPADIEFVPMIWGAWSKEALRKKLDERVLPNIRAGKIKRLLGFNEPDKRDQSNMSYIRALKLWPALEKLGIPLCSPACANPEGIKDVSAQGVPGTWMKDFMREVDKKGYRVDYIGVHWYGGTNSSAFKAKMKRIYKNYGNRPLLITEFAPADWKTGGNIKKHRHTRAKVLKFMKEVLPWLEEQDWIAGYAWFSFGINTPQGTSSALFDENNKLTACGRYYKSVSSNTPKGDQNIKLRR